jgi:hypothetical protein
MLTREEAYQFIRARRFAVISTTMEDGWPESALIGIAVSRELEIIFDTTDATRKCANLRRDPRASLVIGWRGDYLAHTGGYQTMQYCGTACELKGMELERFLPTYFNAHPEGHAREGWPGLTYFRIRPHWLRYSTYYRPRTIAELTFEPDASPAK